MSNSDSKPNPLPRALFRNRPAPIEVLEARIAKLKAELASSEDEVAEVKRCQAQALSDSGAAIVRAQEHSEKLISDMQQALAAAAKKREQGQALISSGKKLLSEAAEDELVASEMDVGEAGIAAATQAKRDAIRHWSEELSRVQDSKTRRKRTRLEQDLQRLARRVAAKKAAPEPRGTVETDVILLCPLCHEKPKLEQLGGAGDGDIGFVYHLGCRCGRGSTAENPRDAVKGWNAQAPDLQRARRSREALLEHQKAAAAAVKP
jgi:hypothetical protein